MPDVPSTTPEPPIPLKGEAEKRWKILCPLLSRVRILTDCDLLLLARYCDTHQRWVTAKEFLDQNADTYQTPSGYFREYPQADTYRKLSSLLLKMEGELGLTPSSRSRINVEILTTPGQTDSFLEYLRSNRRKPLIENL